MPSLPAFDPLTLAARARREGWACADLGAPDAAWTGAWDDLPLDPYLDRSYGERRRRFAAYDLELGPGAPPRRRRHGATHLQAPEHNRLFGGVERRFAPLADGLLAHQCGARAWDAWVRTLEELEAPGRFLGELHAFRVQPLDGPATSTPEGEHSDGRDWVFVLLVARAGVAGGALHVRDRAGRELGAVPMDRPGTLVLLDDRRVRHVADPITATGTAVPRRDALVATFRREGA